MTILKKIFNFVIKYPVFIILTGLLITLAVLGLCFGQKIQIGGLLEKLWGGNNKNKDDGRNTIPKDRVDEDGKPIEPGESDDEGYVQAPVSVDIKKPGIFSDPKIVEIIEPDGTETKIPLPDGMSNSDVKEVIILKPRVYEVKNMDGGAIVKDLNNLKDILNN